MTKISMDKQYRTRAGREVRIYAVDGGGPYPVQGAYFRDGLWLLCRWDENGFCYGDSNRYFNLIEVKPRIQREYWVNVPPEGNLSPVCWLTKEKADGVSSDDRIACVKITIECEEGEGL